MLRKTTRTAKTAKSAANGPEVVNVVPSAAIPGGELHIRGGRFMAGGLPSVTLGKHRAHLTVSSDRYIVAKVPETATEAEIVVVSGEKSSDAAPVYLGVQIADSLHPVANPAIDAEGNIYATFSNARGQKSPVSIYKIDTNYNSKPFVTDLMNPTGLAFDRDGILYCSSRYDGIVYQVTPTGNVSTYVEGMGVATGIAFDSEENLYVGDRSGTIFKISRSRQIYVFATLEASIAAYHLAFGPDDVLYVTGPTTSSHDAIYRVSQSGEVSVLFRGIGRPQGLALDAENRLYVAGSLGGRRGILRISALDSDQAEAEQFLSGPNIVGLAFAPSKAMIVATQNALYRVDCEIAGRKLI